MHAAFAFPTDDPAFAPEPAPPEEVKGWVEKVFDDLRRTLSLLDRRRSNLPEQVREDVGLLLNAEAEVFDRIESVSGGDFGVVKTVVKTRHHGDYHLGQVLVVNNDFQILDFEGEPARSLAERRAKNSPLRDVAGMLRSFNYAGRSALAGVADGQTERLATAEPWVRRWEGEARGAFLEGYVEGVGDAASYPEPGEARALIELFTIEKALYEIRYELDNRPDWVGIPVRGILDLMQEPAETEDR